MKTLAEKIEVMTAALNGAESNRQSNGREVK